MSKCAAVSKFSQPGQRHKWSAVKDAGAFIYHECLNLCGTWQEGTEIPSGVRRQFEFEAKLTSSMRVLKRRSGT